MKITQREGKLTIQVSDDGKGLSEPTMQLQPGSIGVGIGGMRERARELGGELRMLSANPGTTVEVVIPSVVPVPAATATA